MNFFDYFVNNYIKVMLGPTYIVTEIITCFCIAFLFSHIKLKDYKTWIIFGLDALCTFAFNILFSCVFNYFLGLISAQKMIVVTSFIKYTLYGLIHVMIRKEYPNIYMRLFLAVSCGFFVPVLIQLSGNIGGLMPKGNGNQLLSDLTFYFLSIPLISIIIMYKYISPFKFRYTKPLPSIIVIFAYLVGLGATVSSVFMQDTPRIVVIIFLLIITLLLVLIYFVFYFNVKNYNQMIYFQMSALKKENEINEINISKQQFEEYHRIKHDLKNELAVLNVLYKNKEFEKMDEYFADINDKIHVKIDSADTGNALINSILDMEIAKAMSFGINVNYSVVVPSTLGFVSTDITSLLCNLLDNAIEAEARANIFDPIKLSILYQKPNLFITVSNKFDPSEKPTAFKSHKTDRKNHGYGSIIIDSIVKQNEGTSYAIVDKNVFTYEIMIIEKEKQNE